MIWHNLAYVGVHLLFLIGYVAGIYFAGLGLWRLVGWLAHTPRRPTHADLTRALTPNPDRPLKLAAPFVTTVKKPAVPNGV